MKIITRKSSIVVAMAMTLFLFYSCGGGSKEESSDEAAEANVEAEADPMANKGIGPIRKVELGDEVDAELAAKGEEVYTQMCSACHKVNEKYIGPAPAGILDRRSPEWIMNMILNPVEMVEKDPIAKALLIEYNGSPMANQGLTEDQARAILEYFRTL